MHGLVDFDNVPPLERRKGPKRLVDRVIDGIGESSLQKLQEPLIAVRFYGGWFDGDHLTPEAQRLAADLQAVFPTVCRAGRRNGDRIRVRAELATTLLVDARREIWHTHRKRVGVQNLQCARLEDVGCPDRSVCPLKNTYDFMVAERCPASACAVTRSSLLRRNEQKLVDTHLVVDLLHLSKQSRDPLCIVSSDDDLWPGIRAATLSGSRVILLHPKNHRLPEQYAAGDTNLLQRDL
jgi:uncharacterized LabA/DUF88 family protein